MAPTEQPPSGGPSSPPNLTRPRGSTPQALLEELALVDEARRVLAQRRFHLVVVPEAGDPVCEEFDGVGPLVVRLTDMVGTKVFAYVFHGERWQLSRPPFRHLVPPAGPPTPLFMPPSGQLELDPSGDLGDLPPGAEPPGGSTARPGLQL